MNSTHDGHTSDLQAARAKAAALFAAAARNEQAGPTAQLHCLTAATTLRAPSGPVAATADGTDPDRLIEEARVFLMIVDRRRTSYDGAVDGLVREAFRSADRLRAAAAEARASGRPAAELHLLERATERAVHASRPGASRCGGVS